MNLFYNSDRVLAYINRSGILNISDLNTDLWVKDS